jgi:DNA-3-methyladenine glycosylase
MTTAPITAPITAQWLSRSVLEVAPDLLGCTLVRQFPDGRCWRGRIVETEAYMAGDPACHAYRRKTDRNWPMFEPGGLSYVYLIYGMYHCINVVTDVGGLPSAVLIRALQLDDWPAGWVAPPGRRPQPLARVAAGPGKLCQVMQIDRCLSGLPLVPGQPLWLEHRRDAVGESGATPIVQTTRIGITQGVDLPWRWYVGDCAAVSKR